MSTSQHVALEEIDGVRVISFPQPHVSLQGSAVSEIGPELLSLTQAGTPRVLLDMGRVEFFSSSFIEVLFRIWNRVKGREGGRFAICSLHPYCKEVLDVTNLTMVWKVFPSREEAIAALKSEDGSWAGSH